MNEIETLALSKLSVPDVRASVRAGKYDVDFVVHIKGSLDVSEDETYTPTTHVPIIPAMALALRRAGVQRDGIVLALVDAMKEVMASDEDLRETLKADVDEAEKLFRQGLAELPRAIRKGKVRTKLGFSITKV
jgi:hypothetical protein